MLRIRNHKEKAGSVSFFDKMPEKMHWIPFKIWLQNMTTDCSLIYKFSTRKLQEHVVYTNCLDFVSLKYRYLHPQKSIKLHNFWMIMSEITWIFYLNLEINKKKWIDCTYGKIHLCWVGKTICVKWCSTNVLLM